MDKSTITIHAKNSIKQQRFIDRADQKDILVLVDKRIGNANQARALADSLSQSHEVVEIEYNHFAHLPNSLLSLWPIHVKRSLLKDLNKRKPPKLIISSGRRPAALAVHLKHVFKGKTKIIQIMRPNISPEEFEMIILPQHDTFNKILPNIVRVIGALSNVKKKLIDSDYQMKLMYPEIKAYIALLIGGSSKKFTFTYENGKQLADLCAQISENHSLPLFITFSRRTPENVKEIFRNLFHFPSIIYDPVDEGENPYPTMIGSAEYIITTCDSVSMCSEVAATGRPIYVYCPENFKAKKHRFFLQQLIDLGIVKRLETTTGYLEKYDYTPLDEISKVSRLIKEKLL